MGRIFNLIKGFYNLFISKAENASPEALLANIQENMRNDIAKFNGGLISQATVIEKLKSQVNSQTREVADLRANTVAYTKAGKVDLAKQSAFDLQKISADLEHNKEQMELSTKTYEGLVKMRDITVKEAKERIEKIRANLSEAQRNKALSNLTEVANSMISETNSHGDQLNRLDEIAEEQRATSAARLKVAQGSLDLDHINQMEAAEGAMKDQALADFLAKESLSLPVTEAESSKATVMVSDGHSL